jgi:hypothetical protein
MPSGDLTRTAKVALAEGEEGLRGIGFELFRPITNCGGSPTGRTANPDGSDRFAAARAGRPRTPDRR